MWDLLERAGSARAGGTLLAVLAGASVLGTVILQSTLPGGSPEEIARHYGQGAWRVLEALRLTDVFHALWYQALLGLAGLSMLCATITRFSLRREKIGFALAHAGVLLVLGGGMVYFVRGEKGIVTLREGEAAGKFESARARETRPLPFTVKLDRFAVEYYPAEMVFVGPNREAVSVKPQAGRELVLPWDTTRRIRFKERLENARRVVEVLPGSSTPPEPAAHLSLETPEYHADLWRFARPSDAPDALVKTDGRIAVTFSTRDSPVVEPPLRTQPMLVVINHATGAVVEIPADAGKMFMMPDVTPAASGEILEILDDPDATAVGPGLRLQLHVGKRMEWRHVFAKFSDMDMDAANTRLSGLDEIGFVYYRPRLVLEVMEKPGPVYQLRSSHAAETVWTQPMKLREPVDVRAAESVKVTLLEVLPSAHVETWYEDAGQPTGVEAMLLEVSGPDGGSKRFWMSAGGDDGTARLDEGLMIGYMASPDVREYRSEITVGDAAGVPERCTVRVNHPVRRGGWEIFQEGYSIDGMRRTSRLAVVRDPGLAWVLAGLVMLSAGIFFSCFLRPATARVEDRA
jgi:hypothetical protein